MVKHSCPVCYEKYECGTVHCGTPTIFICDACCVKAKKEGN